MRGECLTIESECIAGIGTIDSIGIDHARQECQRIHLRDIRTGFYLLPIRTRLTHIGDAALTADLEHNPVLVLNGNLAGVI